METWLRLQIAVAVGNCGCRLRCPYTENLMAVAVVGAHTLEIWLRLQLAVAVADCGCGWKLRLQIAVPIHGEFNGGCGCWSPYTGNLVAVTACGCGCRLRLRLEIAVADCGAHTRRI